jgi:hypothetical protein
MADLMTHLTTQPFYQRMRYKQLKAALRIQRALRKWKSKKWIVLVVKTFRVCLISLARSSRRTQHLHAHQTKNHARTPIHANCTTNGLTPQNRVCLATTTTACPFPGLRPRLSSTVLWHISSAFRSQCLPSCFSLGLVTEKCVLCVVRAFVPPPHPPASQPTANTTMVFIAILRLESRLQVHSHLQLVLAVDANSKWP